MCIWPGACRRAQSPHGLSSMAHQYSGAEISEACRMMWAGRNHCTRLHQCHPPSQGPSRHPSLHLSCRPDQRHMEQGCLDLPGSCCLLLTSVEGVRQASRLYASDPKQGPQAPMSDLDQLRSSALLIPDTFRVTSWKVFTGCILLAAFSLASFRSLASMIEASAIREGYQGLPDDLLFLDLRFGYSPDEAWTLLRNWGLSRPTAIRHCGDHRLPALPPWLQRGWAGLDQPSAGRLWQALARVAPDQIPGCHSFHRIYTGLLGGHGSGANASK